MCGIYGFSLSSDSSFPSNDWGSRAISLLRHRGPDGSGFYEDLDHKIGLAHVRLSILDTSPLGAQPMTSHNSDITLVYNGEIYNFLEIKAQLEAEGIIFSGESDTEVLIALYQSCFDNFTGQLDCESVSSFVSRLNGIFLLRFGINPLIHCLLSETVMALNRYIF